MFQNQKVKNNNSYSEIDNFPVFTMSKDLEEVLNPESPRKTSLPDPPKNAYPQKDYGPQVPFLAQTKSPFLSSPQINEPRYMGTASDAGKLAAEKISIKEEKSSSSGKFFILIIAVLIILILAGGGYYFWTTRQQQAEEMSDVAIPEPTPLPEQEPEPEPAPISKPAITISTDKPNYLTINPAITDNESLKETLTDYMDEMSESGIMTPVEFIVVDTQNNPLTFSNFANIFAIRLPQSVMSTLANSFSLFMYKDQNNLRLALVVDSKNSVLSKSAAAAEEKNLVSELSPLFMGLPFTNPTENFGKSVYKGAEIRYVNVPSTQPLSIDYTVFNKKLLIGTSKMTLRSILDKTTVTTK